MSSDGQDERALTTADEHRILVELLAQQHTRYNDFCQICLTANTLLLGFLGLAITNEGKVPPDLVVILSVAGIVISIIWMLTLSRLRQDSRRIVWQLRDREAMMRNEQGIFRQGYRYMFNHDTLESKFLPENEGRRLTFPKRRWFFVGRFPAHRTGHAFAVVFIGAYIVLWYIFGT